MTPGNLPVRTGGMVGRQGAANLTVNERSLRSDKREDKRPYRRVSTGRPVAGVKKTGGLPQKQNWLTI